MRVIALYADAMQSGKSTVADLMYPHNFRKVAIATPMKAMVADLMRRSGYNAEFVEDALYGNSKEVPLTMLGGVTARRMMQQLGTEWGRNLCSEIWLGALGRAIKLVHDAGFHTVIDDLRYLNEAAYLKNQWRAEIFKVVRPGLVDTTGHSSEGELHAFKPDAVILNDYDADTFRTGLEAQLRTILR
jgi:hypothetical protein